MPSNGLLTNKYNDKLQAGTIKAQEVRADSVVARSIDTNSIQFHSKDEIKNPIKIYREGNNLVVEFDDDDLSKYDYSKDGIGDSLQDLNRLKDGKKHYTTINLRDKDGKKIKIYGDAIITD
jgi:hypothetical protein